MIRRDDEDGDCLTPPVERPAAVERARRLQILERIAAALDRPVEDFFSQADDGSAGSTPEGQDQGM